MEEVLISPCGMNCAICSAYLAYRNDTKSKGVKMPYCIGCRPRDKKCAFIKKRCDLVMQGKVKYCYECEDFPCRNLQHLDKRYKTSFRMSMIENLEYIRDNGIDKFLEKEREKWKCPECSETICCHNGICFSCGLEKVAEKKNRYRWED